jgi:hypothetical protein
MFPGGFRCPFFHHISLLSLQLQFLTFCCSVLSLVPSSSCTKSYIQKVSKFFFLFCLFIGKFFLPFDCKDMVAVACFFLCQFFSGPWSQSADTLNILSEPFFFFFSFLPLTPPWLIYLALSQE